VLRRVLRAWRGALRQVKAPKIHLRDSGLLHALLGLPDARAVETHPKVGASPRTCALNRLYVVHAGAQSFDLAADIKAIAFRRLLDDLPVLR